MIRLLLKCKIVSFQEIQYFSIRESLFFSIAVNLVHVFLKFQEIISFSISDKNLHFSISENLAFFQFR
jgi:hypothetical protein